MKMKLHMLAAAAVFLFPAYAGAADLKSPPSMIDGVKYAPHGWTGVYFGGKVGYGNTNHNLDASYSETDHYPAHCTGGASLSGGSCTKAVEVPGTPASCAGGTKLSGDTCLKTVDVPGTPESCKQGKLTDGKCLNAEGIVIEGDYVAAVPASTKEVPSPEDYVAAVPASTEIVAAPENYVAAVDITNTAAAFIDGINSHGITGGGTVGADVQLGRFVVGIYGDYNFSNVKTKAGLSINDVEVLTAGITEGDSWRALGRFGYLLDERALLYVAAGYGETEFKYSIGSESLSKTAPGIVAGVGAEYRLSSNIYAGLEWQHTFFDDVTLYDQGGLVVKDSIDSDVVLGKLTVKFGVPGVGY